MPHAKHENHPAFISLCLKISYVFIIEKSIALLYPLCLEKGIQPISLQRYYFSGKIKKKTGKLKVRNREIKN